MPARKRLRAEMEEDSSKTEPPSPLQNLRNLWQFANLIQYLAFFGDAIGADAKMTIEDYETEFLSPHGSEKLDLLQLSLLRFVSSQRGLNLAIADEYTRRQFQKRSPTFNPFGDGEQPHPFASFETSIKVRVLYHLSRWTLANPQRIREKLPETDEQRQWRVEPYGFDKQGRTYLVFDDNRLYRKTEPPPTAPPPKAKSKSKAKSRKGKKGAKRQKVEEPEEAEEVGVDGEEGQEEDQEKEPGLALQDDDFGGCTWECIATTLDEYQTFMQSIQKSKNPDEKDLYAALQQDCIPHIEAIEEKRRAKEEKRLREMRHVDLLATAKRSSRIADKSIKAKEEEEARLRAEEEERERLAAKKEAARLKKLEEQQFQRAQGREIRRKEREERRTLNQTKLDEAEKGTPEVEGERKSERQRLVDIEKWRGELQRTEGEDQEWVVDCSGCGFHQVYQDAVGDGKDVIECEKCHAWEHQNCLRITAEQADDESFHFVCKACKRKEAEATKPKYIIKLSPPGLKKTSPQSASSQIPQTAPTVVKKPQPRPVMANFPPPQVFYPSPSTTQSSLSVSNGAQQPVNGMSSPPYIENHLNGARAGSPLAAPQTHHLTPRPSNDFTTVPQQSTSNSQTPQQPPHTTPKVHPSPQVARASRNTQTNGINSAPQLPPMYQQPALDPSPAPPRPHRSPPFVKQAPSADSAHSAHPAHPVSNSHRTPHSTSTEALRAAAEQSQPSLQIPAQETQFPPVFSAVAENRSSIPEIQKSLLNGISGPEPAPVISAHPTPHAKPKSPIELQPDVRLHSVSGQKSTTPILAYPTVTPFAGPPPRHQTTDTPSESSPTAMINGTSNHP